MKMLEYTFQHLPGYGVLKERELWKRKIFTWDDYDKMRSQQLELNFFDTESIFHESRKKFESGEIDFFAERLSSFLYYRIAHTFPDKTVFLDIETTGLSRYYDKITIIGWSILDKYNVHIEGNERTKKQLIDDLRKTHCIVTFNGSLFDLPFIRDAFPDAKIPKCHIDLRFFSRRVSLSGGQKEIERQLNIKRSKDLTEIDGLEATILWYKYKEGDMTSLQKLIQYNAADINGMKIIFEKVTRSLVKNEMFPFRDTLIFPFSNFLSVPEFTRNKKEKEKIFLFKFRGLKGPKVTLDELPDNRRHRIIGIDLTGSEKKATGWALLENGNVITKTILSNAEIIAETIRNKPTIISIDSPLSLPIGRITVYDDDPGRNKYGITRECERIMAKRGVKSYPCLIRSMQRLTERGIMLADRFRKMGYAVIESYPGAAQDILGIPRKRRSMEYLIKGLQTFGISGQYNEPNVTHDEIDAVTSALVGYFYLANQYEALGNEAEDYLIIPELKGSSGFQNSRRIAIGLSGLLASGKTTSGMIIEHLGFAYGRYSSVIENLLKGNGEPVNRQTMQTMGEYVNKSWGQRWLGNELLKLFSGTENVVIDGLRFLEDYSFLRERFKTDFFHIHILTDEKKRSERYYNKGINNTSFEEANKHNVESEVLKLQTFADVVLLNNGSIADLEKELKQIINKLCLSQLLSEANMAQKGKEK